MTGRYDIIKSPRLVSRTRCQMDDGTMHIFDRCTRGRQQDVVAPFPRDDQRIYDSDPKGPPGTLTPQGKEMQEAIRVFFLEEGPGVPAHDAWCPCFNLPFSYLDGSQGLKSRPLSYPG